MQFYIVKNAIQKGKCIKFCFSFKITIFCDNDYRISIRMFDVIHCVSHSVWYYVQPYRICLQVIIRIPSP